MLRVLGLLDAWPMTTFPKVLLLLCLLLSGPLWEAGRNRIEVRARTSDGSRARETSALPVDFDGDGVSDIGIYRDGTWAIIFFSHKLFYESALAVELPRSWVQRHVEWSLIVVGAELSDV